MTPLATQYGGIGGMGYMMDDYEIGIAYEYENFPVLLPYHTLLLLEDPEEILKDIPLDANPTLVKLVQILVPYQWYVCMHSRRCGLKVIAVMSVMDANMTSHI